MDTFFGEDNYFDLLEQIDGKAHYLKCDSNGTFYQISHLIESTIISQVEKLEKKYETIDPFRYHIARVDQTDHIVVYDQFD